MNKKRKLIIAILCIVNMLLSLVLILYPRFTGAKQESVVKEALTDWNQQRNSVVWSDVLLSSDISYQSEERILNDLWTAMDEYNTNLYETNQDELVDAWSYQATVFDLSRYGLTNGPVGKISIPKIDVEMALYLGATSDNMAKGFAQLSQTSMPIGGINTNCVVAGHRGWNGAAYMRDVDQLELGDVIYLENFWETLEYRVCDIKTIEPSEIDEILIQPGRDLLTIVTCTPYGVGTHRILVFCERVTE